MPDNPKDGQIYIDDDGTTWQYNNGNCQMKVVNLIYLTGIYFLKEYFKTKNKEDIVKFIINKKTEGSKDLELRRVVIKKFEEEVLSKLNIEYKYKGNGMGIPR